MDIIKTFEDSNIKRLVFGNRGKRVLILFDILFGIVLAIGAIIGVKITGDTFGLSQPILYMIVILGLVFVNWGLFPIKSVFILDKKTKTLRVIQTPCFNIKRIYEIKSNEKPILVGKKKLLAGQLPFRPFIYYSEDEETKEIALFPWLWFWFDKLNWDYYWNWTKEELKQVSNFLGIPLKLE